MNNTIKTAAKMLASAAHIRSKALARARNGTTEADRLACDSYDEMFDSVKDRSLELLAGVDLHDQSLFAGLTDLLDALLGASEDGKATKADELLEGLEAALESAQEELIDSYADHHLFRTPRGSSTSFRVANNAASDALVQWDELNGMFLISTKPVTDMQPGDLPQHMIQLQNAATACELFSRTVAE